MQGRGQWERGEDNEAGGDGRETGRTGVAQRNERGGSTLHPEEERGGGLLPNGAPA